MEPYLTLCYAIKHGDTGLLRHAIREICIVMQAPLASKPKYAKALLRQVHIIDTTAADPTLQEAYLANALVNLRGLPHTFYKMDLPLEHQNGEFKQFRTDRRSSTSTNPSELDRSKSYYFLENRAPNLVNKGILAILTTTQSYNESVMKKANPLETAAPGNILSTEELDGRNADVNELFRERVMVTSDLSESNI
ncbi:hypothetical protein MMC07_009832 [Pseudocyphellaria aurata]|nr:hypothetical protein [Pseudocyphellaria aurata]